MIQIVFNCTGYPATYNLQAKHTSNQSHATLAFCCCPRPAPSKCILRKLPTPTACHTPSLATVALVCILDNCHFHLQDATSSLLDDFIRSFSPFRDIFLVFFKMVPLSFFGTVLLSGINVFCL
ncbi:unnamed protein product [Somion occarium]|uniref:Uncharacterized protein n=1 Tax=Somion occarium TaxID=3059160 RepID=A0ABP1DX27_9APHY